MNRLWSSRLAIVALVGFLSGLPSAHAAEKRPHVLCIAVDDLRPELGCYGESHIHSPNIDALAASGRRFERAYCQQAVCNPSRTSLMTGRRPDAIGVTGNHAHFRSNHPDVVTLPQHFKQQGYHAAAIGKIYHGVFPDGASITTWDTMGDPESWSVPAVRFGPRYYYTEEGIAAAKSIYERVYKPKNPGPDDWTTKLVFGPATESPDVPDNVLYDGQVGDAAVKTLHELQGTDKPFFLAVGFIKPHSPYIAPKKYFDLYDDVALPSHTEFPADAPTFAGHGSGELRRYTDQPKSGAISDDRQRRVRQAYFACISYIDAQIGRVLDELDRSGLSDNTIVVLYGDHGYHLGEQGLWGKTTNFELDTRVPLIVRVPGMKAAGESTMSLVELVDLYPTLAELAGLPTTDQLDGQSFVSILNNPAQVTKTAALSQYPRGGGLMGYSMRTPTHRLTQWVHRPTGEIRATELYDYADGLVETKSVAGESPQVVERLAAQLTSLAGLVEVREPENPSTDARSGAASATVSSEQSQAGRIDRIPLSALVAKPGTPVRPAPKASEQSLKLPRVFGSHMVLQADAEIPVWGHAKADAKVTVTLGGKSQTAVANGQGAWTVHFPSRKANATPATMSIESATERIQFTDVLIGEVWVCAGQSNMEWMLSQSAGGREELAAADYPHLRLLHLVGGARGSSGSYTPQHLARLTPQTYCPGEWKVASAESAQSFSAVGWYFGRQLQEALKVPVGLICPAVGGTPAEAWIPRKALQADLDLKGLVAGNWLDNERLGDFCRTRGAQNLLAAIQAGERIPGDELGPNHSFKPGFMWDAGIEPLIPYAIRGAIWYQGESNAENPARVREHGRLFPLLINQWRKHWGQGDFPFLYVQLPALNRPEWPWFRDGQRRTLSQLKNVGMAITIDTGHPSNVHPTLKKPIGQRLANWALGTTYKSKLHATYSGPLLDVAAREGDSMVVTFNYVGNGLKSSDDKPLRYFEVSGEDGVFHPASAKIVGRNTIAVTSPNVAEPHDVRYAWLPYPHPAVNLFNTAGLPASPFTTETTETVFARRTAAAERPNILFIVSEDNSAHLGCYGEQRVHTPHLDALAAGGVRYTRAYVPYSVCSPSRAAFLTGLYTRQTGHIGLATHRFSMYRDFKTIPARFQQAGYYTGFLGKTHINPERLVEDYVDHRAIRNSNFGKTISIETYAEEARVVMQRAAERNKPFLLIINYADAHRSFVGKSTHGFPTRQVDDEVAPFPWIGSDTPHLREELRDYFNCLNRLDEGVGMVLDKLDETGASANTLVIYISDHGADFPRGKGSIYENGTRIPMIVNYPKSFPKGKVESGMVSTIDILPTMLRAARLPVPEKLPGFALQDIDSGKSPPRKYIHTFTTGSSPNLLYMQFGIRDDRYKLVYNPDRAINRLAESRYRNSQLPEDQYVAAFLHPPEYELFDLQEDPYEWKNLADSVEHKPIRQRLLKAMQEFQHEIKDPFVSSENIATFIAEQKEYLHKPYKKSGFRWPHLDLFKQWHESK